MHHTLYILNKKELIAIFKGISMFRGTKIKFLLFEFLGSLHRIPRKIKNAVYCLQIFALVP